MDKGFGEIHPFPCFMFYIGLIVLSMTLYHPIFLLTSLILMIALNILQDNGKKLKKVAKGYLLMGVVIVILNPLVSHRGRTVLFYMFDNPITLEAVVYGLTMMGSLMTILIAFVSYNNVITSEKFLYLFSRIFPQLSFLTMLTLRFIPLLISRMANITTVQKTLGIDISQGSIKKRAKDGMKILNILITWSLEEAMETARSMRARGYGIKKDRTFYFNYNMDKRDWTILFLIFIIGFSLLWAWTTERFIYQIYPEVYPLNFNTTLLMYYLLFVAYISIPLVLEMGDFLKWL